MKTILLHLLGDESEPLTIDLWPGITAGNILANANLADYVLATSPAPPRCFGSTEEVYDELLDGDYLLAISQPSKPSAPIPSISREEALREIQQCVEEDQPATTCDGVDPEDDDPSFLYDWLMPT